MTQIKELKGFTLALLLSLSLFGCGKITYKLSDGNTVNCAVADQHACGWTLAWCDGGGTFTCQTNFVQE